MSKIGFVASNNGLGHTRRLIHLSKSFFDSGYEIIFFSTNKQYSLISNEIKKLGVELKNIQIENYGLDGPVWWNQGGDVKKPGKEVQAEIEKCKLVISDNVVWPYSYNQNTVLFGHFTWSDYWQRKFHTLPDLLKKLIEKEINVLKKFPRIFQVRLFALTENMSSNVIDIKMLRYQTDLHIPKESIPESKIWISSGTTGLENSLKYMVDKYPKINFLERETFHLFSDSRKPSMVIGRPGLGTIRDCLAAGLPFYPIWDNTDPEMQSNVEHLVKLGLIFKGIINQNILKEFDINQALDFFNSNEFREFNWLQNSDSCHDIAKIITSYSQV
jgi:hypothetical protein